MSIKASTGNVPTPLISLQKVSRSFPLGDGEITILHEITLDIHPGEFVAIIGQSGSGKTTLMNILGCLDKPSSGNYLVKGKNVSQMDADGLSTLRREFFGFVFQRYNLLSGSTARENVEMPAVYADMPALERQERADALLTRLGLGERLEYAPAKLSGGQQQRVSIARALMNGGEIILADEPTGALDRNSGLEVLALLEELHRSGHTIILITHDSSVAARAKRVISLSDGVVVSDTLNEPATAKPSPGAVQETNSKFNAPAEGSATAQTAAAKPSVLAQKVQFGRASAREMWKNRFLSSLSISIRSLKDNRFRTMLTLLGIIIGVGSVVTMLALGNGAKEKVISSIESMGSDLIMVRPMGGTSRSSASSVQLNNNDVEALKALPGVEAVIGENSGSVSVRYQESDYQTSYTATGVDKPVVANWRIKSGEFFNMQDVLSSSPVVVLGKTVVENIFSDADNPVGKYIMVSNVPFLVVGVMDAKGASAFGKDEDDVILMPVSTARLRLKGTKNLSVITVKAAAGADMDQLQRDMEALVRERQNSSNFRVMNTASLMEAVSESQGALTVLLGSVAAISLLVGGIGVMNIMLVSVVERTREIGIRMACGARQSDILTQFITEALMVCALGGVLGIVLGLLAAFIAQLYGAAVMYSLPPVVLAFGCSFSIGLIFGFTPARKAARLDPVVALASE